ncbi:hypothetical protein QTL95_03685 [Rhizobium sp. S152]|nr:hypothetical protein [Rhizobium sp. S152]
MSSEVHAHDSGHSHEDVELADDVGSPADHHHADHSHEKAGLVSSSGLAMRVVATASYSVRTSSLVSGPQYGIDRPPRAVSLI